MACTSGVSFLNLKAFADERLAAGTWETVLSKLSAEERMALKSVLAVGWYEERWFLEVLTALDAIGGAGDLSLVKKIGAFEAERDLNGFLRFILRAANPAFVVEQASKLWRRFHDTGTLVVVRESGNRFKGTVANWGIVDRALCLELGAYMQRSVELVGAKNVRLAHTECRADGAKDCLFTCEWD
jgi:hypothetical protein